MTIMANDAVARLKTRLRNHNTFMTTTVLGGRKAEKFVGATWYEELTKDGLTENPLSC